MELIIITTGFVYVGGGTKPKLGPLCGLVRGNRQWPGVLSLFSKSKISWSNLLVDLKVKSTHGDKLHPVRIFIKFLRLKNG